MVAHRLSTVARMDQLVVLDHGQIVEQGAHADLLRLDGTYARLWRHQSGGFLDEDLPTFHGRLGRVLEVGSDGPGTEMILAWAGVI